MKAAPWSCFAGRGIETLESRQLLSASVQATVHFQPQDAATEPGVLVDYGQPLGPQAGGMSYGWDRDMTRRAKSSKAPSDAGETYPGFVAANQAVWNLEVPNGSYSVSLIAGNGAARQRQRVLVEDVTLIDGKTTKEDRWLEATVVVSVVDGNLTVSSADSFRQNKLVQIRVQGVDVDQNPPPTSGSPIPGSPTVANWRETGMNVRQTRVESAVAKVGTKLYLMGGYVDGLDVNRSTDVFDASTGVWARGVELRGAQTHAGVTSDGERYIFKAGGQIGGGIPGRPTPETWRFDTQRNIWSKLPAIPEARYAPGMAYVDGKLHVFGGTLPDRKTITADHWVLDLASVKQGWKAVAPMPEGGDHVSTVVIDGKIYSIGGEHGHAATREEDASYIQHADLYRYDPATDQWTELADMPVGRSHAEGTTLEVNGKIIFMGGKLNATDVSTSIDLYDPATDTWLNIGTLPVENQGGAAIYHDGKMYLSHGQISGPEFTMHRKTWVGNVSLG